MNMAVGEPTGALAVEADPVMTDPQSGSRVASKPPPHQQQSLPLLLAPPLKGESIGVQLRETSIPST
jgi:hypothetical protein